MNKFLCFKVNCFNVSFPLCQGSFSEQKVRTKTPNFSFSVTLLNKRPIKLYTIRPDMSLWSVAASLHSTLVFIILCKYTGSNRRNVRDFGRVFLRSNHTDITQNTYIQSCTVTKIMAIEICGLLWCQRTVRSP
jgi:hypothetical protein